MYTKHYCFNYNIRKPNPKLDTDLDGNPPQMHPDVHSGGRGGAGPAADPVRAGAVAGADCARARAVAHAAAEGARGALPPVLPREPSAAGAAQDVARTVYHCSTIYLIVHAVDV